MGSSLARWNAEGQGRRRAGLHIQICTSGACGRVLGCCMEACRAVIHVCLWSRNCTCTLVCPVARYVPCFTVAAARRMLQRLAVHDDYRESKTAPVDGMSRSSTFGRASILDSLVFKLALAEAVTFLASCEHDCILHPFCALTHVHFCLQSYPLRSD